MSKPRRPDTVRKLGDWDEERLLREFAALSSEFANTQRELARRNVELQRMHAARDRLLQAAAHDLRNPLNAISLVATCLSSDDSNPPSDRQKRLIESIEHSSDYMLRIVEGLLDVSVLDGKIEPSNAERMDLSSRVERCIDLNEVLAERKRVRISRSVSPSVFCSGDSTRVEQVVNNLIANAIAYSPIGGDVRVVLEDDGRESVFSVTDRGCGIPEQELDRLFKPFPKISSRPTGNEKTVGLGLAICRSIIDAHAGRIWAESEVGVGSTFRFALPVSK